MIDKYKILFKGEFKSWVGRDDFIKSFTRQLGVSREKAEALFDVDRKITLKKSLSDSEVDRHMAAFEKLGMVVTKRLMLKPFVGPRIENESKSGNVGVVEQQGRSGDRDGGSNSKSKPGNTRQNKKNWSGLTGRLKSMVGKTNS
ncbi:MAG: hypothetical protein GY814_15050 [Gammaproteobacteria bacterium]|nr:hypothetical protein [Gammaproteobacteria bacterium]